MELNAVLAANLDLLSDALNDSEVDIATTLGLLARDLRTAVDSYAGLSLTAARDGHAVTFTVFEHGVDRARIVTSMLLPLLRLDAAGSQTGAQLVLYAERPGAFPDLAADLAWLTGQELAAFTIDQHLAVLGESVVLSALREESTINQAIGVLIGRGYALAEARRELEVRAAAGGTTRYAVADGILAAHGDPV